METLITKANKKDVLTLAEIRQKYPHQWVLVIEPELDHNLEIIRGKVVVNSLTKEELYEQLHLREGKSSAIEYTGEYDDAVVLL
ncbi:MAG: hypothetical protein RLZZ338_944 [Cyanobacteriota bacterium]|jgi:hypothetical protein